MLGGAGALWAGNWAGEKSHHGSGCTVGRRSGSLGILEQSRIGDTAALGFLPKCSDCREALNHKCDEASVNPRAVLDREVLHDLCPRW